ncbi:TetR family transcriptional regulator [Streptomyces sp. SCSIO 30461]|uniref:TetR/AcrR family transcriptional regulator n=1 Tax=Streptomyces sp. SCSIO 30461 TaxID=3118085 RepID=UPI0030CC256A
MARNPERRIALVDAAIEVLAREGARGLTFRAVDIEAGVPTGTASNYFANRDDLFTQAGARIHVRMAPDPADADAAMRQSPTRGLYVDLMRWLLRRMTAERTGYLALLEMRLEATRRPTLAAELNKAVRAELDANRLLHLGSGLPGDADAFLTLYLAMTGLMLEHFTLPGVLADRELDQLVETMVNRIIPES